MDNNKPLETDTSEDNVEEESTEDESIYELFEEEGGDDVEGKGELSLEELNKISGREFKSKEDYLKHYENLKKLVGDQDLAKKRKEVKQEEAKKEEVDETAKELAQLKKDLAKKDFLIETPTAKPFIEPLEAYADRQGVSLEEAWNSESFQLIAESSQRTGKKLTTNNKIAPARSKEIDRLQKEVVETGSEDAKLNLVKEFFKKG
jgi:hypothetical protein